MADTDIVQVIAEARIDARSLSEFVFKPANFIVSRRLAPSINTLQYYIDKANSVNNAFSKSVSDATAAADIAISAANTANQNAIGLIDDVTNQATQSVQNAISGVAIDANLVTDALTTISPITNTPTARTQLDKNRESVSALDFFTLEELTAYRASTTTFDAYRPLQAFFDYISANDVGTARCDGVFYTDKGIVFGGESGSKTKQVVGDFHICALGISFIHTLFLMQCGKELTWLGSVHVQGVGGLIFGYRKVQRGLVLGGAHQCAHTYITAVNADNGFIEFGVLFDNLTTASVIDGIRVTRCGSGRINPSVGETSSWTDKSAFTVISEELSSGLSGHSILKMEKMPVAKDLRYRPVLKIGDFLYHCSDIDYEAKTVKIFPFLDRDNSLTSARYIYGAGVCTAGGDASVVRIGKINSTNCGVVYHSGALYAACVGAMTTESNTINLMLGGNSTSQAHVGGSIDYFYCEASEYDIVRKTRAQLSFGILTNVAFNFKKFYDLTRLRNPSSNALERANIGMEGIFINYNGFPLSREGRGSDSNDTISLDVTDINRSEYWHYGSSKSFNIKAPDLDINNAYGYNRKSCIVMGVSSSPNGAPTGDIVFNAPAGYTVNGGANVVFNGFTQAAKFDVYLQFGASNFVVVCLSDRALQNTVTYNPPSLPPTTQQSTTVTLVGAKIGDSVAVSINKPLLGTRLWAEVTESDVVTVYHRNDNAEAVDVASGNLKVKVI